ncbi:unnamed protein product, partial [Meganyctiphanes norvegica]
MGKDKNVGRTKGNQKPSSSARTAEKLGAEMGIMGFDMLSDMGYVPASSQGNQGSDSAISEPFRIPMLKMRKKDSTTKIRALQEFESLCESEDQESILTTLPFWPRLYNKISIDVERRVREGSQASHAALAKKAGKQLAPHLRAIMPAWILAMVDPHAPASKLASAAFKELFSEEKRAEVIFHCYRCIIDHITSNLFDQTPETLSDPKTTGPVDMESKYTRVIHCSLAGLGLVLTTTSKVDIAKKNEIMEAIQPLIKDQRFWKLAKNKDSMIRSAWFALLKDMFEYSNSLLADSVAQLSNTILPALDDQEGTVLTHIWIAFLHLATTYPEFWKDANSPRSVLGRIFSVMREGARGSAPELYPQLLPILSVLPDHIMENTATFYKDFFRSFTTGLMKDRIITNSSDISAVLKAIFECMRFISKDSNLDITLWETIIKYQVVDVLKNSMMTTPQLSNSSLYYEVSSILRFWFDKMQQDTEMEHTKEILTVFWKIFLPECLLLLEDGKEEPLQRLNKFIKILACPTKIKESNEKEEQFIVHVGKELNIFTKASYNSFLNNNSSAIYEVFATLLTTFPTGHVYASLLDKNENEINLNDVMSSIVVPKLILPDPTLAKSTVQIFTSLYSQMDLQQQKNALLTIKVDTSVSVTQQVVESMVARRENDSIASEWLKSPQLGSRLLRLAQLLCAQAAATTASTFNTEDSMDVTIQIDQELEEIIEFVISNANQKDPVFSLEYLSQIVTLLGTCIPCERKNIQETTYQSSNQLADSVSSILEHLFQNSVCWQIKGIYDLLRKLFLISCQPPEYLLSSTLNKLKSIFFKAFAEMIGMMECESPGQVLKEGTVLHNILKDIRTLLVNSNCSFATTKNLVEITREIFSIVYNKIQSEEECVILLEHSILQNMLDLLLPTEGEWTQLEEQMSSLYVAPSILQGTIAFGQFPFPKIMSEFPPSNFNHTRVCMFLTELLVSLCASESGLSDVPQSDLNSEAVSLGQYTCLVVSALHSACYATVMCDLLVAVNYKLVSEDVLLGKSTLCQEMKKLIDTTNQGNKRLIVKQIKDRCSDGSSAWCVTLKEIFSKWLTPEDVNVTKLLDGIDESALGLTATKQTLMHLLPKEIIMDILNEEVGKLSSLSEDPFSGWSCVAIISSALGHLPANCTKDMVNAIFSVLTQWREEADNIFLFATYLGGLSWEELSLTSSIVRLVTILAKNHGQNLAREHWDFVLCSLSSWVQSLEESKESVYTETAVGAFTCAVCKLVGCIGEIMEALSNNNTLRELYAPNLLDEWQGFFSSCIYSILIPIYVLVAESYKSCQNVLLYGVLRTSCVGVFRAQPTELSSHNLPPVFNAQDSEDELKLPDSEQILLNHLCPLLLSSHPPTQFSAYNLIKTSFPHIMCVWEKNEITVNEEDDAPQRPLPYALTRIITEKSICDSFFRCQEDPEELPLANPQCNLHVYFSFIEYILYCLQVQLLTFKTDMWHHPCDYIFYRESGLLQRLLLNLFRLMPSKPILSSNSLADEKTAVTMFNTKQNITPTTNVTSELISWLACQVYYECVSAAPAVVRHWWSGLDRRVQQIVDKFTTTYVSTLLIQQEISAVSNSDVKFDNMTVRARIGAGEVVATYTIDEASMELVLRMAPNHPLTTVSVEDHRRVGVSVAQWRNWLLGLTTMLSHRNTPLLQSLEFWKKNVDQKFEGVEECYICFYVLHGTNHQLPKLLCRTCKKKYHSACLYKWFSTSNNSTCPLCRALF